MFQQYGSVTQKMEKGSIEFEIPAHVHERSGLIAALGSDDSPTYANSSSDSFHEEDSDIETIDGERRGCCYLSCSWKSYVKAVEKYPLLVKSVSAFIILGAGDLCGQGVEHWRGSNHDDGVDWIRMLRFAAFGFLGAPWNHYYYFVLDFCLPPTPEPFSVTTAVKLIIDQFIHAPILLAIIIFCLGVMEGENMDDIQLALERQYWNTLLANWKLWIPASLVNLAFVRPTLRVLFDNIVFFVWTIILSLMLSN